MNVDVDTAVIRLIEARERGTAIPADFITSHPLSINDGLLVQAQVQSVLGPTGAWKIGPASTPKNPSYAPIAVKNIQHGTGNFIGRFFHPISVECELAFRIGRDLVKPPYTWEQVVGSIEGLVFLIEVCESRLLLGDRPASCGWRIADNLKNGAIVIGQTIRDWQAIDLGKLPVTLKSTGNTVAVKSGNPTPERVSSVLLLANQAGTYCGGLRTGHVVTTGNICGNIKVLTGSEVVAQFGDVDEVRITV